MAVISQGNDFCLILLGKCTSGRKATNRCKKFKFWNLWECPLYEISEYAFKGIVPDRGRSQKFEFFNLYIALPLQTHFPKGIEQKSFQGEMRAIYLEILMSENLFNTVAYEAIPVYILNHA